jgi:hypothetical protein
VIRDIAVLGLCALIIYEIYRPTRDLVRMGGEDDPAGGVLDGAPDRVVLTKPRRKPKPPPPAPPTPPVEKEPEPAV